jgi:hypothetical protein
MLTRKIDAALDAITACRTRTPDLLDCYRTGAPERVALERLMAALDQACGALTRPGVDARANRR